MDYYNGNDRILYIKQLGAWLPIGCLTSNSLSESAEMMNTTTRDNNGWYTGRPTTQNYVINFDGLQINTVVSGGNFGAASYDRLKLLKRSSTQLDWKIEGSLFPTVDYGKCYLTEISEASAVEDFLTFSGTMTGYGIPLTQGKGVFVLNDGDPNVILTTSPAADLIIRTND